MHFLHLLHPTQMAVGARSASRKARITIIAYARVIAPNSPRYETNRKVTLYEQKSLHFIHNALRFAQKSLRYGKIVAGFARKPPRNFVPRPSERLSQAVGRLWNCSLTILVDYLESYSR